MIQAAGEVIVCDIFSWHTLAPLVPTDHHLITTAYLSIVAEPVHPFMTTVYSSCDDYFQQDIVPRGKAQIIIFCEHDNEFTFSPTQVYTPYTIMMIVLYLIKNEKYCFLKVLLNLEKF